MFDSMGIVRMVSMFRPDGETASIAYPNACLGQSQYHNRITTALHDVKQALEFPLIQ